MKSTSFVGIATKLRLFSLAAALEDLHSSRLESVLQKLEMFILFFSVDPGYS